MSITNPSAFTIDVEDGINISMRDNFNIEMEPTSRVVSNVNMILELCETNGVKATFFILGEVAGKYPVLVRSIADNGHEIGVHGYHHDQIFKTTPERFKNDLRKAKDLIENLTGQEVMGFRAPAFSINKKTSWALPIIAECGFQYDSSIVPASMGRYGWSGFYRQITRVDFPDKKQLIEVPLPVISILGRSYQVCGGGYLRYFPLFFTDWAFSSLVRHQPVIVYTHPYELDTVKYPDYFYEAIRNLSVRKSLPLRIYRFRKGSLKGKLDAILGKYDFVPLKEIIGKMNSNGEIKSVAWTDLQGQTDNT